MSTGLAEPVGSPPPGGLPLLRLDSVSKQFPGVLALDRVDFDLRAGEVHVLFGENGAGKSTLISMVAGAYRPTDGHILFKGAPVELHSVHQARGLGISAVFQEFSLVPQLTVEENLFLGAETRAGLLLDKGAMHRRAVEMLDRLGFPLKPTARVAHLSRAQQQMVEIAKAFRSDLSVLILDEPTASLTERETDRLFALIAQAKAQGVGIIYITHRLAEIKRIADRITVLRDGKHVATLPVAEASEARLVELMTGRVISQIFPKVAYKPAETLLEIEHLTTATGTVRDVSIHVRAGEIVGLAGLVGSGKSEVARACFGIEPIETGRVRFLGRDMTGATPRQMLDRGFFYVPPDRRAEGLVIGRGARENILLPALHDDAFSGALFLKRGVEKSTARGLAQKLQLHPFNIERPVEHFSGGNQQKVLLAKALTREVKLFVFDEPTVGVDVGTRVAIYDFIRGLCEAGAGVLLISSDLPEILHLTNRAYVMYRGSLRAELQGADITEDKVLRYFFEREAA
ncbi:sugar ABC transporter ATP-binding protein [Hypericibacter adhaerens]|uniref:sugar ABC transporter ATP-binding protein n=1 Tax=Hypericibacter adhaerens TaxID=2602016 RepID=UPI001244A5C9|nr:sugar ABC transporter ATP-binding protein [Hypericibacter adhaerens]